MFLIGTRDGIVPRPIRSEKWLTVREALTALPAFGQPGNDSICKAIVTPAKKPVMRKSPYAGMLFNGQGRPMDLDAPALTLPASMGGNRTPIVDQASLEANAEPWVVGYHARLMSGGKIISKVPGHLRRLTVEEAACLQGFPLGMVFAGSQCTKFRQIGNSVPPALGEVVGRTLRMVLEGNAPLEEWRGEQRCWIAEEPSPVRVA